jgi:hypothetical protein
MRYLFVAALCLALLVAFGASATTYRWVDEDGVTHFSDSPRPGSADPESQVIDIPRANVIQTRRPPPPPRAGNSSAQPKPAQDDSAPAGYQALRIVSPSDGDTLWNIGGTLNVGLQVSPALRAGDGIVLLLDGKLATPSPVSGTSLSIGEVYRGEHRISAIVRGANGQDLITSAPVTFFVQQASVN